MVLGMSEEMDYRLNFRSAMGRNAAVLNIMGDSCKTAWPHDNSFGTVKVPLGQDKRLMQSSKHINRQLIIIQSYLHLLF